MTRGTMGNQLHGMICVSQAGVGEPLMVSACFNTLQCPLGNNPPYTILPVHEAKLWVRADIVLTS